MDDADRASELEQAERDAALRRFYAGARNDATQPSARVCRLCREEIPAARRRAVPGVKYCVSCQTMAEMMGIFDWNP